MRSLSDTLLYLMGISYCPSLSFRVGEGWLTLAPEAADDLRLIPGEKSEMRLLRFGTVEEVFKRTSTGTPTVVEAPKDMVGWFQQHPYLLPDKPEP
jgi:hypothetical protein